MTEKPERDERPEDEGSGKAPDDDIDLDDFDFEDLLADDNLLGDEAPQKAAAKEEPAKPEPAKEESAKEDASEAPAGAGSAEISHDAADVLDDGDIDLLADDDVLDIDDLVDGGETAEAVEEIPDIVQEPEETPGVSEPADASAAAAPAAALGEDTAHEETVEEIPLEELLAEDIEEAAEDAATTGEETVADADEDLFAMLEEDGSLDSGIPEEGAVEDVPALVDETAEVVEPEPAEETAGVAQTTEESAEDAGKASAGKKSRKFGKKFGKKGAAAKNGGKKKSLASKAERKPARISRKKGKGASRGAKEKAPRPVKVSAKGSITFVCSECYEELLLSAGYSQDVVTCPECLHVGKRPDEDFIRTVQMHKTGEKTSLAYAVVSGALFVVAVLALLYVKSPYYLAVNNWQPAGDGLSMGLLGGAGLLGAIFLWLAVRSEGNRWEVYF